jgi:uncharacterized membrane protein YphA (DoxX/SURF4 family)
MLVHDIAVVLVGAFFSILFIQSGLDKMFNWKDELEFNTMHFEKTFMKPFVPVILGVLTCMELGSGITSAAGLVMFFISRGHDGLVSFIASIMCAVTLLCLFFGQRIAKDYPGAQGLVSYFIVAIAGVCLFM